VWPPGRLARAATRLALLVAACAAWGLSDRAAGTGIDARIEPLEAELSRTGHPDSIRIELAIAYRARGGVENRLRALWLLEELQPTLSRNPRLLREYCLTLEACHRYDLACHAAERLVEVSPDEIDIRLVCVRAAVRTLLRYDRDAFLDEALEQLDRILVREPAHLEALHLKSLVFAWWALRDRDAAPGAHRQGLACAEEALRHDPQDIGVRLLEGAHRHGLGDDEGAEICFRRAIALMDSTERRVFLRPPEAQETGAEGDLVQAWRRLDPIPLSVVNEGQLEYWYRLALADAFFGTADRNVRGWDTDPGKVLVRYGPPEARSFETAYMGVVDASIDGVPAWAGVLPPLEPPMLTWTCSIGGHPVSMTFRDPTLAGSWRATPETWEAIEYLDENLPIFLAPSAPAPGVTVHLLATSFSAGEGRSRAVVTLGFDPAALAAPPSAEQSPAMSIRVTDEDGVVVASDRWRVTDEDRCASTPALPLAQTTREYPLAPGDYALTAEITHGSGMPPGTVRIPFEVHAFPPQELAVSDLELIQEASAECPAPAIVRAGHLWLPRALPLVGDARALDTYFEIYNLAIDAPTGQQRFQVRYTLLPRAYTMALAARGGASDSLARSAPGAQLDETILTHRNYVDVLFPEEMRRGRSGASVAKAAALPVRGLDVGAYELTVTVHDLVRGSSASSRRALAIMTDGEIMAASAGVPRRQRRGRKRGP
jgi:GWxTD domain-containing protein